MNNNPPINFKEGINVLMLIDRGVQNSNKGSKRWINKIITSNPLEWKNAYDTLLELQWHLNNPNIRLYQSMNDRKLDSAIKLFKHNIIDVFPENEINFYMKLNDRFCSCLMKPENKKSKWMLLDIDLKDTTEVDQFISDNCDQVEVFYKYETINGWHYIVHPFNVSIADGYTTFEVKKDGLMLLNVLE